MIRRVLLLAALLGVLADPAWGAAAFVQSTSNGCGPGTSCAMTFASNTTAGNAIVGYAMWSDTAQSVFNVTGCSAGALTLLDNPTSALGTFSGATFLFENIAGGACTLTVSFTSSVSGAINIMAHEVSGIATSSSLDQHAAPSGQLTPGTGTDAVVSGAITTTASGDYIFCGTAGDAASYTSSAGTGFTLREQNTTRGRTSEDQVQSSAGSITCTFTINSGTANTMTAAVAVKAAGAGAAGCAAPIGGGIIRSGCPN